MLNSIGLKYLLTKEEFNCSYRGGDKTTDGKNFVEYYEQILDSKRNDPVRFLEIGVWTGCSIAMWSEYFSNGIIYGIDCNLGTFKKCLKILLDKGAFKNKKINFFKKSYVKNEGNRASFLEPGSFLEPSSNQKLFLKDNDVNLFECNTMTEQLTDLVHNCLPQFDIILDDGNHAVKSQYRNFKILFNEMNSNGIYIIEDIENATQFFSYKYFGAIFQLLGGQPIDFVRENYASCRVDKHQLKYTKLKDSLAKITQHINKANKNIDFLIDKKRDLEQSLNNYVLDIQPLIDLKFQKLLFLVDNIDKIENRGHHIIFFKK